MYKKIINGCILMTCMVLVNSTCPWPPKFIHGRKPINTTLLTYTDLELTNHFMNGGHYKPYNCTARQRVTILVPYRDREPQLRTFLLNVIPALYRQQLEFKIVVVEQVGDALFNKGMLINIGYLESMKDWEYDCLVIHDVDLLPGDERNFYICSENPVHMCEKAEPIAKPLYQEYVGGVINFTPRQFEAINGFSNLYQGWGCEDDDCYRRILLAGYKVHRPNSDVSFCGRVKHDLSPRINDRCEIFLRYARYWKYDGLKSIEYKIMDRKITQLYTWILADIDTNKIRKDGKALFNKGLLVNIGYLESMQDWDYDCLVIHDVDLLPVDERNLYICSENPVHMCGKAQPLAKPLYAQYIGGVINFTPQQFETINGFSNLYQGWGCEDDDCFRRIIMAGYTVNRPNLDVSHCGRVRHDLSPRINDRCEIFLRYARYWKYDGLKSIDYKLVDKKSTELYKWILADIDTNKIRKNFKDRTQGLAVLPVTLPWSPVEDYCKMVLMEKIFNFPKTRMCISKNKR